LIEQAMILALGFLVAGLISLLFLPAVQRRAARLSARRLEMLLPLSMEEIVAERDQLRAEFAVERRRVEQKLEAAGEDQARHMAEVGRQAAAIITYKAQLSETQEEVRQLGEAKETLQQETREAQAARGAAEKMLAEESGSHAATRDILEALRVQHLSLEQVTHEQRTSLAGLETRAATLDLRILALGQQKQALERNLQSKTTEAEVLLGERDLARVERDGAETKRATLQRRLDEEAMRVADLRDQIEALRRRVDEAERLRVTGEHARDAAQHRSDELTRRLEQREERARAAEIAAAERHEAQRSEIARLTGALEAARRENAGLNGERRTRDGAGAGTARLETELRRAVAAEAEWRSRYEKQAAEIVGLAGLLEQADRHEGAIRNPASSGAEGGALSTESGERQETALLRQAIADLGSQVVRITTTLKDSGSSESNTMPPDVIGLPERRNRVGAQS
jgi:chromosome segregation ATPase